MEGVQVEGAELLEQASALAQDMLALVRDSLQVSYRFMNRPLSQLPVSVRMDLRTCATNARELAFSPGFVLDAFRSASAAPATPAVPAVRAAAPSKTPALIARAYLHMTLHCLLRHPFLPEGADPLRWSCACDAAVCAVLQQLESPAIHVEDPERDAELARILEGAGDSTAAGIYAYLKRAGLDEAELVRLNVLFGMDGHDQWNAGAPDARQEARPDADSVAELRRRWEKIARQTQMDVERDAAKGDTAALSVSLGRVEASFMGLDELLRQFAAPSEAVQVNPDEFDYIYYTYGLATYGNIPLVEPLEYRESPRLRDFVVAIDTSGSVDEALARRFVAHACGMLLGSRALGNDSRVRVVQCDNAIQDEWVLREPDDVLGYLDEFVLRGRGGTDFRPVFEHVEELMEQGTVTQMAGLVYFTDGQGEFPSSAPPFDVAFVFPDKLAFAPPWATSVLAYSDEL